MAQAEMRTGMGFAGSPATTIVHGPASDDSAMSIRTPSTVVMPTPVAIRVVSGAPSENTVVWPRPWATSALVGGLPGLAITFRIVVGSGASARGPKINAPFGKTAALVIGAGTSCTP